MDPGSVEITETPIISGGESGDPTDPEKPNSKSNVTTFPLKKVDTGPKIPILGPREGTKSRLVFDLALRPGGVTNEEIKNATGHIGGYWSSMLDWQKKYGVSARRESTSRNVRYFLERTKKD